MKQQQVNPNDDDDDFRPIIGLDLTSSYSCHQQFLIDRSSYTMWPKRQLLYDNDDDDDCI
ncbi:hypothetical protein DERF_007787 [Dermatophagoides farinae]|uniref:Uncharacterized protein n=1 Tax=Dermatophagoides farinae TaxID=6954 RepID=A0A922I211_DERFA|nr:hypothetical protein DERF_007787 [Dermatophagoides farinae]